MVAVGQRIVGRARFVDGADARLVGQCAIERQKILLTHVPPNYIRIASGLGDAPPQNILVLPVIFEGQVKGVLELASFERFNPTHQAFLDQLTESIGIVLNTINPGPVNTGYLDPETTDRSLAELEAWRRATPFGHWGRPTDPARLIGWLATDHGVWVAGQVITTDGGLSLT